MARTRGRLVLPLAMMSLTFTSQISSIAHAAISETGEKGAQIYCFMRASGNEHEVSWKAAYAVMKRQTNSLFKTSPQHGAVMIIEAVVEEENNYPNCGSYLGDLFPPSEGNGEIMSNTSKKNETDRYSY